MRRKARRAYRANKKERTGTPARSFFAPAYFFRFLCHADEPVRRFQRVAALRRLAGEHQAVRAVQHGVVDVQHLRTGGGGVVDHAVQQLSHHQKRLSAAAAQGGDVLLGGGQLLQRQTAAQVSPGDGHHVAQRQPVRQSVQPRPVLHLSEQLGIGKAVLRHSLPHYAQVVGAADKGLHDGVHAQRRRLRKISKVCLAQGGAAKVDALQRQTFVAGEDAAPGDAAHAAVHHAQCHGAVVQQYGHAGAQGVQHVAIHGDIRAQRDGCTLRQRQRGGRITDTHLRAAQVDHQLGAQAGLLLRRVQGVDPVPSGGQ